MYNQARTPNFNKLREQVPPNIIRPAQQAALSNLQATSPANRMYQQQHMNTTVFVAPNQPISYMAGQSHIVTMGGRGTVSKFTQPRKYVVSNPGGTTRTSDFTTIPDQWSPINPSGKRVYDSQFLRKLQYSRLSTKEPDNVSNIPQSLLRHPKQSLYNTHHTIMTSQPAQCTVISNIHYPQVASSQPNPDQWSPINPSGKRVYDSQFLRKLQYSRLSTKEPDNVSNIPQFLLRHPEQSLYNTNHTIKTSQPAQYTVISNIHYPQVASSQQNPAQANVFLDGKLDAISESEIEQEMLTCSVCLELVQTPHTLMQCLHSYCEKCVKQLMAKQKNEVQGVTCPLCHTFCSEKEIKYNSFVNNLVSLQSSEKNQKRMCEQCTSEDAAEATWMCKDCRFDLCDGCKRQHLRIPLLKAHTVVPALNQTKLVVDNLVFCTTHTDKVLELYCNQCHKIICNACHVEIHQKHEIITGQSALDKIIPGIGRKIGPLQEKLELLEINVNDVRDEIVRTEKTYTQCREEVDMEAETRIAKIKQEQEKLKESLQKEEQAQVHQLRLKKEALLSHKKKVTNIKNVTQTTLEKASNMSLLTTLLHGGVCDRLEQVTADKANQKQLLLKWPQIKKTEAAWKRCEKEGLLGCLEYNSTHSSMKILPSGLNDRQLSKGTMDEDLSDENIKIELERLLTERRVKNEDVLDWVDKNVKFSKVGKPVFIRCLMTSVCSGALTQTDYIDRYVYEVDTKILKERAPLLQPYLDKDPFLQVQALYALEALVHQKEHPNNSDLLRTFFDTLYDQDIIHEDAFWQWYEGTEAASQTGHDTARKSVTQFFCWLGESDSEASD